MCSLFFSCLYVANRTPAWLTSPMVSLPRQYPTFSFSPSPSLSDRDLRRGSWNLSTVFGPLLFFNYRSMSCAPSAEFGASASNMTFQMRLFFLSLPFVMSKSRHHKRRSWRSSVEQVSYWLLLWRSDLSICDAFYPFYRSFSFAAFAGADNRPQADKHVYGFESVQCAGKLWNVVSINNNVLI